MSIIGAAPSNIGCCCACSELPNVLITPHTGYYTEHALRDVVENTMVNCLRFDRGATCAG